jgi:hypothetical protein
MAEDVVKELTEKKRTKKNKNSIVRMLINSYLGDNIQDAYGVPYLYQDFRKSLIISTY